FVGGAGFLYFNGRPHHLPHVELGAGGDIGTEADCDPGFQELIEFDQAAAEKKIRTGAVGHARLSSSDGCDFERAEMNAMPEHSFGREQSVLFVNMRRSE